MVRRFLPLPLVVPVVLTVAFLGLARDCFGQGPSLKSVIDEGLGELARRQLPDGSYDRDLVTTADAVLAYVDSPRRYGESDGPFLRRAIEWLSSQIDAAGRPIGIDEIHEQVAVAGWLQAALSRSKSAEAAAALQRLHRFLDSDAVKQRGEAHVPEAEFERTGKLPVETVEQLRAALDPITSTLCSEPGLNRPEFERWLRTMPALLADVAARFPDLTLETTLGGAKHWSTVLGGVVLRALHAPAGFEEASARNLAAGVRALTICHEKTPKENAPSGGGPPKPTGTPRAVGEDLVATYREAARAALAYLAGQQKDGRFGFMGHDDPGITALALAAVLRTSRRLGEPPPAWIDPGLDWLVSLQKPNGAIHAGGLAVYVTSASLLALTQAARPKDHAAIERGTLFLKVVQRDEPEGYDPNLDWGYGGIGYGDELRPDLSNTQFGLEAMHAAGVAASDPAMQRAILFLQRCQNDPEFNARPIERADGRIVKAGSDGGAGYHPGESKAGLVGRGDGTFTPRSYGSMTYALLKCYLFAGLPLADPRVKAALDWIQGHWSVEVNPGFETSTGGPGGSSSGAEYQGLFYYYFTMAKALDASGLDVLTGPDGTPHRWRDELLAKLLALSFTEGFWTNQKASRWMEEFPVLATSYALVAMDHCLPPTIPAGLPPSKPAGN